VVGSDLLQFRKVRATSLFWSFLGGGDSNWDESSAHGSVSARTTTPLLNAFSESGRTGCSFLQKLGDWFGSACGVAVQEVLATVTVSAIFE
jgi:hypothetical protein